MEGKRARVKGKVKRKKEREERRMEREERKREEIEMAGLRLGHLYAQNEEKYISER